MVPLPRDYPQTGPPSLRGWRAGFLRSGGLSWCQTTDGDALMSIFTRAEQHLLRRERRIMKLRPHWLFLGRVIAETLGIEAVTFLLHLALNPLGAGAWLFQSLVWYVAGFAIARLAYYTWWWWEDITIFTDRRVLRCQGLIKQETEMTPAKKIADMKFGKTYWGALLGYGWFRIESAGTDGLEFYPWVSDLRSVEEALTNLVFADSDSKSDGLPPPRKGNVEPETVPLDALDRHWPDEGDDD